MKKAVRWVGVVLFAFAAVAVPRLMSPGQTAQMSSDAGYQKFLKSLRQGVLTAVPDVKAGAGTAESDAALAFVATRSGIVLDEGARSALVSLEGEYQTRGAHSVTTDLAGAAIADWMIDDVLASLTPAEVDAAIEAGLGFKADDLPESFKQGRTEVRLNFAEPPVVLSPLQCRQVIESAQASGGARETFRAELRQIVTARVVSLVADLNAADAARFRPEALSPVEVFLVAYSAITGDALAESAPDLRTRMQELKGAIDKRFGVTYPSPQGRLAYGTNGYLASSPADIAFRRASGLFVRLK